MGRHESRQVGRQVGRWVDRQVGRQGGSLATHPAVIIMPSPRDHILDFFSLAAALSGNGQSAKSKFLTTITSLIPKIRLKNGRGSGRILDLGFC